MKASKVNRGNRNRIIGRHRVPNIGWPITRASLDSFYARAQPVLELGPYEYGAAAWQKRDPSLIPFPLDPRAVWTKMWQFSPPTRFGTKYRDAIFGARNVHLFTYANVCELEANEAVNAVDGLRVRTIDGKEHRARARHYVLAASTIQNARLLLSSNRRATAGLGNAHDLVGRYFMEHDEFRHRRLRRAVALWVTRDSPRGTSLTSRSAAPGAVRHWPLGSFRKNRAAPRRFRRDCTKMTIWRAWCILVQDGVK